MKKTVAIIDYGMGNLHSVASAVEHEIRDRHVLITDDAEQIGSADHVIFPGVGAIRDCMDEIRQRGLDKVVMDVAASGKPLLGVCIGMQALMSHSDENGGVECFNYFSGDVKRFSGEQFALNQKHLKVPHMGWNNVSQLHDHPVWHGIADDTRFYFVHSYYCDKQDDAVIGTCEYGVTFAAAMAKDNVIAAQFHPEKSHVPGLRFLRNFLNWDGK